MNLARLVIGTTAVAALSVGLAGTAFAAPPAPPNCTAPGLVVAIGNANTHLAEAQAAIAAAQTELAAVLAEPAPTPEQIAAAQQAVADAEAAMQAAQDRVTHLGLVSAKVASNRCRLEV